MNQYALQPQFQSLHTQSDDVHIASLILQIRPENRADTLVWLEANPVCTTYEDENKAALVIVLEVCEQQSINRFIDELNARAGVLSVNLVYHHCDSASTLNQELNT